MIIHIEELIKPDHCGIAVFHLNKDMAKAIFDVSHQWYYCRTRIEVHKYPYTHYEIIAYIRPMGDEVDVFESTDGTNWYQTN